MKLKNVKLIVASTRDGIIGTYDNKLPWTNQKADMKRFVELTTGNIIIMGGNTFQSLKFKPLPNRLNIVMSTTIPRDPDNKYYVVKDLKGLRKFLKTYVPLSKYSNSEIFVIGGRQIYKLFMELGVVTTIYKTIIYKYIEDGITLPYSLTTKGITESYREDFQFYNPADTENNTAYSFYSYSLKELPMITWFKNLFRR